MASVGLNSQRRGYGNKLNNQSSSNRKSYGTALVSRSIINENSLPTKSMGNLSGSASSNALNRKDVFDFPSEDEDDEPSKAKRAPAGQATGITKAIKRSAELVRSIKPVATAAKPAAGSRTTTQSSKSSNGQGLQATSKDPSLDRAASATKPRDVFDFPESDEEVFTSKQPSAKRKVGRQANSTTLISRLRQKSAEPGISSKVSQQEAKPVEQSIVHRTRARSKTPCVDIPTLQSTKTKLESSTPSISKRKAEESSKGTISSVKKSRRSAQTTVKKRTMLQSSSAPAMLSPMVEESTSESPPSHPQSPSPVPSMNFDTSRTPIPTRSPSTDLSSHNVQETPSQKDLWSKLLNSLGEDDDITTHMPRLKLSHSKKRLIDLPRSSSDVIEIAPRKKAKILDTLSTSSVAVPHRIEEEDESSDDEPVLQRMQSNNESQKSHGFQNQGRITYSQQRSRLADPVDDSDAIMDMLIDDFSQPLLTTLTEPKQTDPYDLESDSDDVDEGGQPKSAHDLRAAGSKKRLLQDLESLVSGVEGEGFNSMGAKRSDLIDLVQKCFEPGVVDCFLDHELDRQLLVTFNKSTDAVFNFLAATCLSLLIKNTKQATVIRGVNRSGFVPHLVELLDIEQDISRVVRERRFNMSGIAQKKVRAFRERLLLSDLWSASQPQQLSPQLVALQTLDLLVRQSKDLSADDVPLDEEALSRMFRIIEHNPTITTNQPELRYILSILESHSASNSSHGRDIWTRSNMSILSETIPSVFSTAHNDDLKDITLRLILNLTNNNSKACKALTSQNLVDSLLQLILQGFTDITQQTTSSQPDTDELILALGAMINLAELNDQARSLILLHSFPTLQSLISIFTTAQTTVGDATSIQSSRSNVAFGYLALLFINLCQSDDLRHEILNLLPGTALDGLIDAAEEFIAIHQKTDDEMFSQGSSPQARGEANAHAEYTRRLIGMVQKLKSAAGR